jgi:hypothetical protein
MSEEVDGLYLARTLRAEIEKRTGVDATDGPPTARGTSATRWLSENATDPVTGKSVLAIPSAGELLREPRRGWLNVPTVRGIAHAFGWRHESVYIPNAIAIGLTTPRGSRLATTLPTWIDELPPESWRDIRAYVELQGKAHGLTD